MRRLWPFLLCTLSLTASAVPHQLTHQGRLMDSAGTPLTGDHAVTFTLYDDPASGSVLWTETATLPFDAGYFTAQLGSDSGNPLSETLFLNNDEVWLGLTIDGGTELGDRVRLVAVPYAIVAARVEGGTVDAESLSVGGATVVDGAGNVSATSVSVGGDVIIAPDGSIDWSHIANAPASSDTLADLQCNDTEIASWNGVDWTCTDADGHTHVAGDIVDGQLALARIPVGGGADQVAPGNHTHTAADVGALPADTTLDDLGGLPASGGIVSGDLQVSGAFEAATGLRLGDSTLACDDASHQGQLKYDTDGLWLCTDTGWKVVVRQGQDGSTQDGAGVDCKTIKASYPDSASGLYWLDPDGGSTANASRFYCDMDSDGGGFTLCAQMDVSTADNTQKMAYPTEISGTYNVNSNFVADCSVFDFSELLFTESWNGTGDEYLVDLAGSGITPDSFYATTFNQLADVRGRYLAGDFTAFAPKEMMWTGNRSCPAGWNGSPAFRLSVGEVGATWSGGSTSCYAHEGNYCHNPVVDIGGHVNGQASPDWAIGGDWSSCQYDGAERRLRGTQSRMFVR